MLRGRFEDGVKNNLYWIAGFVVLGWIWAMYRYSHASFIPVPDQGLTVLIKTKCGIRYISELDYWIFVASTLGVVFLAGWGIFQKTLRRK